MLDIWSGRGSRTDLEGNGSNELIGRQQKYGPHQSSDTFGVDTDLATVFGGNNSCLMTPGETEGPFCKRRVSLDYLATSFLLI